MSKLFITGQNQILETLVGTVKDCVMNETVIPNIGKYKGQHLKIRGVSWSSLSGFGFHLETNDGSRHRETLYHIDDLDFVS